MGYRVAVLGATGLVGQEMLLTLEGRAFPVDSLVPIASSRSLGRRVRFAGADVPVQLPGPEAFQGVDIVLSSAGGSVSRQLLPLAAAVGAVSIDNTSAFRMDPDVPLVVPEVNPHRVADYRKRGIIANPNCSTIQMVVALKPLHDAVGVRRVIVSTYQSVSGAGRRALEELNDETASALRKAPYERKIFPKPIAFNVIPQIGDFGEDGVSTEERKMMQETVKIMETDVVVDACCVRAPVRLGHSEAVWIETAKPITPEEARRILNAAPGVRVIDDPARGAYPTAAELDCEDDVLVGRVRRSGNFPNGLSFWIVSDNLRKGAAQNAVQIAEHLVRLWEREGRAAPASISGG